MAAKKSTTENTKKQRKYYETHREEWNEYQRDYKRNRYNDDLEFKARTKEYQREYYRLKKGK